MFATAFLSLRRWSSFPAGVRGGLLSQAGMFAAGSLPTYLLAFASFRVSGRVIDSWIARSLAQSPLAGMAVGRVADGMIFESILGSRYHRNRSGRFAPEYPPVSHPRDDGLR